MQDHHHIHYNRAFGIGILLNVAFVVFEAALGVAINTATALLFVAEREKDLNIRGAFLHMAADAAVSLGVVVAGIGILTIGWFWIDPVVSLAIAAIILIGTWRLLVDSLNLVLQAVPAGIDPAAVTDYLQSVPGITAVHDLHIWAMSTTETALTAHIVKPEPADDDGLLMRLRAELNERFGIPHVTLQVERSNALFEDCGDACRPRSLPH